MAVDQCRAYFRGEGGRAPAPDLDPFSLQGSLAAATMSLFVSISGVLFERTQRRQGAKSTSLAGIGSAVETLLMCSTSFLSSSASRGSCGDESSSRQVGTKCR